MSGLTYDKIISGFESQRLAETDYIKKEDLLGALNGLNGSQFDQDIFNQLWDECKVNSAGEAKVSDFANLILKAE